MHSRVLLVFLLSRVWKCLNLQHEDYITIRQYPDTAYIKYGTSAFLACMFDFRFLSYAEIEVYWNLKLFQLNDTLKKIPIYSSMLPLNSTDIFLEKPGKYRSAGNIQKGIVFLEVMNLQPQDTGAYTCKVARLMPPPYLEGISNETYLWGIEDKLEASFKPLESHFVIYIGVLAVSMIVCTIICIWARRKSSPQRSQSMTESMVYMDMNFAKRKTNSEG
ncbi:PREDICTED: uncharacterized protein LOC109305612 isoform X1 [Crocodylus porosus]|uniref:uncharacterized protein LOC109305612 isoform X1 n=1 Tax=Crocodylus porosus TaxID=8502 RepID=UPI000939A347|nr:PREDICTED: uncharacterized protein LOC109305612 isoform X1 [Crocodylus porosus]